MRYGDRLSSLLVVTNREGSEAEAFQGFGFISLTDVNVVAEGRAARVARTDRGSLTARRTHLNLIAEPALGVALPSFQDVQTKVSWRPRQGSGCRCSASPAGKVRMRRAWMRADPPGFGTTCSP